MEEPVLLRTLSDVVLEGKRVLLREDLNVPCQGDRITSDARLKAALPTLQQLLVAKVSQVVLLSHRGRPQEGVYEGASLAPVAAYLSDALGCSVPLFRWGETVPQERVVVMDNIRCVPGETSNDPQLAQALAALGDVFVNDAFACAHRAHASTEGVAHHVSSAVAGPLLLQELAALAPFVAQPKRPYVAVVGGSKVSGKMPLLRSLLTRADVVIIGGGMANTFLKAQGHEVGVSFMEAAWVDEAKKLMHEAKICHCRLVLPVDVRTASGMDSTSVGVFDVGEVPHDQGIFDVGPKTEAVHASAVKEAATVVWNGPLGVFERPQFAQGTQALIRALANSAAYSVAGGGDTLAALEAFEGLHIPSYVSTGGGAMLDYLEEGTLPALLPLQR